MKYHRFSLLSFITCLAVSGCSAGEDESSELFVAMIMTKDQRASAVPTDSGILVRSSDSGEWSRLGPAIQMISSATVAPGHPEIIYLACGNGIVRTTDAGETWRLVSGWRESDVLQIAIDPENIDRVYAASTWGVTVSTDGGETWTASNTGLKEYFAKGIVLDHRNPQRLLLANTTGLFSSNDRAQSWQRVDAFPEVAILRLRRSQSDPDVWLAGTEGQGVFISKNDGNSWQSVAPQLSEANVYAVAIDPREATHLAAGGWGTGVHVSADGGQNWSQTEGTLPSPNITALVFDETVNNRLWASTFEDGTFFSDDLGATWQSADLDGAYVFDIGFLPAR